MFEAGLKFSNYIGVDDTGARHNGKNGVCTYVGNNIFSHFVTTDSKSRINFIEILHGKHKNYRLDEETLMYAYEKGVSKGILNELKDVFLETKFKIFETKKSWNKFLDQKQIKGFLNKKILTEGALLASVIAKGVSREMIISSAAAPQFAIFLNALCWIHEERHYRKWIPKNKKKSNC